MFDPHWQHPTIRHFWWPAFETIAAWFIETETRRRAGIETSHAEVEGSIDLAAPAGDVTFGARADRIDRLAGGGLAVLDYKTGETPSKAKVAGRRRTQLLVEAVIAAHGGFEGSTPMM
ncbi:MAG: hypothetical protein CM15mP115_24190 [Alphaproteobacteria bacterium]|nr:MAG: hypothetical protein CM15mP115_24190 [Alphaproteobacteria bacterium]